MANVQASEMSAQLLHGEGYPGKWLITAVIVSLSVLLDYLMFVVNLKWTFLALAAMAISVLVLRRWPYGALIAVVVASAIPRLTVQIFSWNAKAEHFVGALVALVILARVVLREERLQLHGCDWLLLAFVGMNYVGSSINSPEPKATLRWALLFTLACASYFVTTHLLSNSRLLRNAINIFLLVGTGEAIFGLLCFASQQLFGTSLGMGYYAAQDMPAIQGSQLEPNLFGSQTASFAVMFFAYSLAKSRQSFWYLLGFLVTTLACLLSLARAAWFGFLAGLVFVLWFGATRMRVRLRKLIPSIATVLLLGIVLSFVVLLNYEYVGERLATLANPAEAPTFVQRQFDNAMALEHIRDHPLLGWGSSSFELFFDWNTGESLLPAWVANLEIRVLHDTGIIGLAMFLLFLGYLLRDVTKVLKKTRDEGILTSVGALLGGSVVLLVAFQACDATTMAFPWVHLGLLAAAIRIPLEEKNALANGVTR